MDRGFSRLTPQELDRMNTSSNDPVMNHAAARQASAEQRLKELGITLPVPRNPCGIYAEAVQTGNLLFLTGMLPTAGKRPKFIGPIRSGSGVPAVVAHGAPAPL